jgi:alpha-D-xyloside xylohydrolase
MPLFVKAGSIIPEGPELQFTAEKKADPITLRVYTGKDGFFALYEDENVNYGYEKGKFSRIPLRYNAASKTLTIGAREGTFDGMLEERSFNIIWVSSEKPSGFETSKNPDQVIRYNGKEIVVKE